MSNEYIITPVKDFVENAIKEKSFLPTDLSYPGFKVSKQKSISLFASLLQTKVLVNYNLGLYRSGKNSDYDFSDLVEADMELSQNKRNAMKAPLYEILENLLPKDIKNDINLMTPKKVQELSRNSLVFGLSHHIKSSILDIDAASFGPINELSTIERPAIVSQLAATLIYFKHNNPEVFKELHREIEKNPVKKAAEILLEEISVPTPLTIQTLHNFDKKFAQEYYPTETAKLSLDTLDRVANKVLGQKM